MQMFINGKLRYYPFMEFCDTSKKIKGQKFNHNTTLMLAQLLLCN